MAKEAQKGSMTCQRSHGHLQGPRPAGFIVLILSITYNASPQRPHFCCLSEKLAYMKLAEMLLGQQDRCLLIFGVVLTFALCFHLWVILSLGDVRRVYGGKQCYHCFVLPRTMEFLNCKLSSACEDPDFTGQQRIPEFLGESLDK